ncbi:MULTISPECIES: glycosyltransferase [unclassified Coleofasciculus]|uniref:glycosyltransferase n=1 Tax=unclassified Coleofasciculus TaxID=2692782 RepID=UPI001880C4A3|nr:MULTISPECIES: glycosyltransferase [unclassified Coleofasciculus]MBE9125771.1 glycosyltransferase family 4 protein [Coleofasciculus sp. LEGE 07081]MBE9148444.1 glycosyltransferase family 4 protein [Coleofasciculus sp. LEGE 07092]
MNLTSSNYLMILQVNYYRIQGSKIAIESAFLQHLRLLKAKLNPVFSRLTVALVEMDDGSYEKRKNSLEIFDEEQEGIFCKTLYTSRTNERDPRFIALNFIPVFKHIYQLVKNCDVLHSGLSHNIWFPTSFMAVLCASLLRKPTVYVVDIDFRNSAWMYYKSGEWSLKSYLLCKYVYDKFRSLQIWVAISFCSLVLLKGRKMCEDYGRRKAHVINFLNAAHSEEHIIDSETLSKKLSTIKNEANLLEVVYFGRLVTYKGIDRCIQAVALAQKKTKQKIIFHIIGSGEEKEQLVQLTEELGMQNNILFHGSLPFGPTLFKKLYECHLLLAAPLREDTPRSALDAMAAGIPILAFDTYYYKDLEATGAVTVVPWLSTEQLAEKIVSLNINREKLADMAEKAVDFAKDNTQEIWLEKRFNWTIENINEHQLKHTS